MKLATAEKNILSSEGLGTQQTFKINTSATAFKLLSSGLYSDKIGAVLREIGCNAADAHKLAGCADKPFEVKLPNSIDNQFYIKDFGPGLSDKDIKEIYSTYFMSTKDTSDDFTGAFGLGSKSPFSYTDNFTIESRHDGLCHIYSAHISDNGAPTIAKMGETPCNDTGLTIAFPVKKEDFHAFKERAQVIYQYFTPVPKIIGGDPIVPITFLNDKGTYVLTDKSGMSVLMGNVHYPLDTRELHIDTGMAPLTAIERATFHLSGIMLRLKIGEVQVTASREKLDYTENTRKVLKEKLQNIVKETVFEIEKDWKAQTKSKTWADICKFKNNVVYESRARYFDKSLFKEVGIQDYERMHIDLTERYTLLPHANTDKASYNLVSENGTKYRYETTGGVLYYKDNITLVWGIEQHARHRIKKAFADKKLSGQILLVTPIRENKGTIADVKKVVQSLQNFFIGIPEKELKDLPAPVFPKPVRVKKGQLRPLPADMLATKDKIWVRISTRSTWSGAQKTMHLSNGIDLKEYELNQIHNHKETLKDYISFADPWEMRYQSIKSYKMDERTDWENYHKYMEKKLTDPMIRTVLKDKIAKMKLGIFIDPYRNSHDTDFLSNMVHLRRYHPDKYDRILPVLNNHGISDTVEEIYKNSQTMGDTSAKITTIVQAYENISRIFGITVNTNDLIIKPASTATSFKAANTVPWNWYQLTPAPILPNLLNEILGI